MSNQIDILARYRPYYRHSLPTGQVYEGNFRDDMRDGQGIEVGTDGMVSKYIYHVTECVRVIAHNPDTLF